MVFADDVADYTRAFLVGLVISVAEFVHGPEYTPVHRLQSVAHVGQRAPDDHRHGIVQIGPPHLVFDTYVLAFNRFHSSGLSVTIRLPRRAGQNYLAEASPARVFPKEISTSFVKISRFAIAVSCS